MTHFGVVQKKLLSMMNCVHSKKLFCFVWMLQFQSWLHSTFRWKKVRLTLSFLWIFKICMKNQDTWELVLLTNCKQCLRRMALEAKPYVMWKMKANKNLQHDKCFQDDYELWWFGDSRTIWRCLFLKCV